MKGLKEEAKEDIGCEEQQREDDGAAHAAPCAHDVRFFLLGFLFVGFLLGSARVAAYAGITV